MKMQLHFEIFTVFITIFTLLGGVCGKDGKSEKKKSNNFYSFSVMDIYENTVSLDEFKGKVSLVVNVASHCGYTDTHYSTLQMLQELFASTNAFTVLAFPCNQFGQQEPGNHHQIMEFAFNRMGANFPLFAKINVINNDVPEAWNYLIENTGKAPDWNFWKYLVDHNGKVIDAWGPSIAPDQLYHDIQAAVDLAVEAREEKMQQKGKAKKKVNDEF